MSEWTKEPWLLRQFAGATYIMDALPDVNGRVVANVVASPNLNPRCEANFRRIVACVTACRDIPTEELEEEPNLYALRGMANACEEVRAQRDELLAAAEELLHWVHCIHTIDPEGLAATVARARAAVARARGEAPPAKETP